MILDTNAISALADEDENILRVLPHPYQQYLPIPALAEYRYGLINSRYQKRFEMWLDQLENSRSILTLDEATAHHYAFLYNNLKKKGQMIPINDIWIAALALQHDLPILSEDRHFDRIANIKRIGWILKK